MSDPTVFRDVLLFLMAGGGGVVVWWLMDNVEFLKALMPDYKRWVSWGLAALVPILAWGAFMLMGYEPLPTTWQQVVERLWSLVATAIIAAQGLHGVTDLRKKRKRLELRP